MQKEIRRTMYGKNEPIDEKKEKKGSQTQIWGMTKSLPKMKTSLEESNSRFGQEEESGYLKNG